MPEKNDLTEEQKEELKKRLEEHLRPAAEIIGKLGWSKAEFGITMKVPFFKDDSSK